MKSYLKILVISLLFVLGCSDEGGGGTGPVTPDGPQAIPGNLPTNYDPTNFEIDFPNTLEYHSRWSPDGQYIAFTKYDHIECQNWLYEVSTGDLTPIVWNHGGDYYLSWSPNGNSIVLDFQDDNGINQIWVVDVNTRTTTQLTNSSTHVWGADWCRTTNKIIVVQDGNLIEMSPDGSDKQNLFDRTVNLMFPTVSWDGSKIAFCEARNGNLDIFVINRDGSNEERITTDYHSDLRPRWSPDGTMLLYESDRSGNEDIYVYNFSDNSHTQITNDPGYDSMSDWSPNGDAIVYSTEQGGSTSDSRIKVVPLPSSLR